MKALVIGDTQRFDELRQKFSTHTAVKHFPAWEPVDSDDYDVVFDVNFDDFPRNLAHIAPLRGVPVFVSAVKRSLAQATFDFKQPVLCPLFGMNALPGFIHRELLETSVLRKEDIPQLDAVMNRLGWNYKTVDDRAGMITPRILCMIINEACYTLQEGTASMQDIDISMKLGTNYPFGPFEWADKIGVRNVYEVLDAIYTDTRDERYKICPLLKMKYLKEERFY